ncbi:MAG: tripartite tricarboxylate transporter permease [bacterium]
MIENLIIGFEHLIQIKNLAMIPIGVIVGVMLGAIPGLGSSFAITIMIPMTYWMSPEQALIFLTNIGSASVFGGSLPAILLHIPGTGGSTATTWEGYSMTKKGEANRAVGISLFASSLGGFLGSVIVILFAPMLALYGLKFSYPEVFLIAILAVSLIASASGNLVKGFFAGFLGLLIASVGTDPISAIPRFTFHIYGLYDGVHYVVVLIGLFGISEIFFLVRKNQIVANEKDISSDVTDILEGSKDVFRNFKLFIQSSFLGTILGAVPGIGPAITNFMAYNLAVSYSKTPKKFGTGVPEGIVATESCNTATQSGALIPTCTLGIPGSGMTAALLAGFMLHGLAPGPQLFIQNPEGIYSILIAFSIGSLLIIPLVFGFIKYIVKIVYIQVNLLIPIILLMAVIGAFGINNSTIDIVIMIIFGILGYYMRLYNYPISALVLPIILGPKIEEGFRKGLMLSNGDYLIFFTRPICIMLWIIILLSITAPFFIRKLK